MRGWQGAETAVALALLGPDPGVAHGPPRVGVLPSKQHYPPPLHDPGHPLTEAGDGDRSLQKPDLSPGPTAVGPLVAQNGMPGFTADPSQDQQPGAENV